MDIHFRLYECEPLTKNIDYVLVKGAPRRPLSWSLQTRLGTHSGGTVGLLLQGPIGRIDPAWISNTRCCEEPCLPVDLSSQNARLEANLIVNLEIPDSGPIAVRGTL